MTDHAEVAETVQKPRRRVVKSTGRQSAKPIKTAVSLSPETMRRLVVHSAMSGKTQSQIVAELIDLHCRRFVVSDRGGSVDLAEVPAQGISAAA